MTHTCHAIGCSKPCPPSHLMCERHWFMVPVPLRRAVWAALRNRQGNPKDPTWLATAKAAIAAVVEEEKRVMSPRSQE